MLTIFWLPSEGISPIAARSLLAIVTLWGVGTLWRVCSRWRVRTTLGVTLRRVTSWGITLSGRRIATIRLPICWLWCISSRRGDRLIDA
uniref:Uncharacterized protein n=1 Tax=Arundo donax TaxID=35708 RepID=A0A0A9DUT2_ARUDO